MQALDTIHPLDGIIVATLVVGAGLGALIGIARPIIWFISYSISAYLAAYLNGPVTEQLKPVLEGAAAHFAPQVAFVSTFLGVYLILFLVTRVIKMILLRLREKTNEAVGVVGLRPLDRLVGTGVGFALAGLLAGSALLALAMSPDAEARADLGGSKLRPRVASIARAVLAAIPEKSRLEFEAALQRLEKVGTQAAGEALKTGLEHATDKVKQTTADVEKAKNELPDSRTKMQNPPTLVPAPDEKPSSLPEEQKSPNVATNPDVGGDQ